MMKKKRSQPADAAGPSMNSHRPDVLSGGQRLRRRAEAKLNERKKKAAPAPAREAHPLRLVHELQVHQIELEMQNEELAQARDELEKLLRQYTDLYDFAPVGYLTLARDGTILQVNLVGANLLGVERSALIKRRFGLFVAVESRPAFNAFLENLLSADGKKTCELALLKNGNALFWARLEATSFEGGQECRVALVDISDRKQADEKLRQSEERIRYILDNMVEGGQLISHDWRYLYVNNAVARQGRRKPEELLGHSMLEMYPGIETTELFAALQRCLEDRGHRQMLNEFTYSDGSKGWFELSILPVPEGIFILSNDITARTQAEGLLRASEERYRDLIEISPNAILVASEGRLAFVNPAALKLLGAAHSGQLIGKPMWEIIHPDSHQFVRELKQLLAEGPYIPAQKIKFIRLDGSPVDVEVISTRLIYQDQPSVQIIAQDITARKQVEEALHESQERFRSLSEAAFEGIMIHDRGIILDTNQAFADLFGFHRPDELIGRNGLEVLPLTAESLEKFETSIRTSLPGAFEIEVVRSDGSIFPAEMQGGDMIYKGRKVRVVAMRDISESKQAEELLRAAHSKLQAQLTEIEELHIELREQAIRDPLTGLHNRRYLFEALALEVPRARREGYPISIILLDIDYFKTINDTFGHDTGDEVLKELAAQLKTLSRAEDIVCRYGGDEHLIVMHNTSADKALERADQLRKAISKKRLSHAGKSFKFTCSFGVAVFPVHAPTIEEVISVADRALYQSKEMGRNRVTLL